MKTATVSPLPRRTLLGTVAAALTVAAAPASAKATAPGTDAEWISLCNRLVAIAAEQMVIFDTIEDEDQQQTALAPLTEEHFKIEARLWELDNPTTPAAFLASARAAVAHAPKDAAGNITLYTQGVAELLAFAVMESMVDGGAA
jgi:hypothetical protein